MNDLTTRTVTDKDIELVFVKNLTGYTANQFFLLLPGAALPELFARVADVKAFDSVFISVQDMRYYTVSHEIGHVLTQAEHEFEGFQSLVNLMRNGTTDIKTPAAAKVTDTKRITAARQRRISVWSRMVQNE